MGQKTITVDMLAADLLDWYDANARDLPWRIPPGRSKAGERADLYKIWLSEIMLQQTGVVAVIPYFLKFMKTWPSIDALAHASLDDVLTKWAGLGYYARARNLHKCAQIIAQENQGKFPTNEQSLLKLPGIGPYTAAAISAIAFGNKAIVVDGNVERVMARFYGVENPLPLAKAELRELAHKLTPDKRCGDYAQAVMDLGAMICRPSTADCPRCPWRPHCVGLAKGIAENLPYRAPKPKRAERKGIVFWIETADGKLLIRRRPAKGLLGGMMELPSTPWLIEGVDKDGIKAHAPIKAEWREAAGQVRHTFTHFHLTLEVRIARGVAISELPLAGEDEWQLADIDKLEDYAFPSVMTKLIAHVQALSENEIRQIPRAPARAIHRSA